MTHLRSVQHDGETIWFELVRSNRRTLGLTVKPDGTVTVRAPRRTAEADVLKGVAGHAPWILRKRRAFAQLTPRVPLSYTDGEAHMFLGRRCRLAIEHGEADGVRLAAGRLRVTVRDETSPEHIKQLLDTWYAAKARSVMAERLDDCWAAFPSDGLSKPRLRLSRMRTRWGSMSPRGSMSLRLDLIRAPLECIDYVVFHELCHLVHPNHGREFWALVEQLVPDWKRRKKRLDRALA